MSDHYFLVPYAYDRIKGKEGTGTKARIDALAVFVEKEQLSHCLAVLTAGYDRESPADPTQSFQTSLAEDQKKYLFSRLPGVQCLVKACAWGTLAETREAINLIRHRLARYSESDTVAVIISSNPWHLYGRVRLCWLFLKPAGWKLILVPAKHRFTNKERFIREPVRFVAYFGKLLFALIFRRS